MALEAYYKKKILNVQQSPILYLMNNNILSFFIFLTHIYVKP